MAKRHDLIGKRFGRLLVTGRGVRYTGSKPQVYWICVCDCGTVSYPLTGSLVWARTKSCGCLNADIVTKHGASSNNERTPEYTSWDCMVSRCTRPSSMNYHLYG